MRRMAAYPWDTISPNQTISVHEYFGPQREFQKHTRKENFELEMIIIFDTKTNELNVDLSFSKSLPVILPLQLFPPPLF